MSQSVSLGDADIIISDSGKRAALSCGKLSLAAAFSAEAGLIIESFKNISAERPVEYVGRPQSFMPFVTEDELKRVDVVSDVPVNIVRDNVVESAKTVSGETWSFVSSGAQSIRYGGVGAVEMTMRVSDGAREVALVMTAFPSCSVVRYRFDIHNLTSGALSCALSPFKLRFTIDGPQEIYRAHWFKGATCVYDYGNSYNQAFDSSSPKIELHSQMMADYVPLFVLTRDYSPRDGVMIEMDYAADWALSIDKLRSELCCEFMIDFNAALVEIPPDGLISSPVITTAAFSGGLDDMMVELYDWQYKYLWDYTSNDYFAKTRESGSNFWVYCSRILNEQFAYRLIGMDLLGMKNFMAAGYDIQWDDAGWSSFPGWPDDDYSSVFKNTYEGPDHRLSTRYFKKNGIKRLLWFAGKPSKGLLDTKHGAWGEFEWRTDGLGNESFEQERDFKKTVVDYLRADPRRSFHTCSGGARYANSFDVQRYANYHYAADFGSGPFVTYYYSYFDLPDKWGNLLLAVGGNKTGRDGSSAMTDPSVDLLYYNPDHARSRLALVPITGPLTDANTPLIREDLELYRFMLAKGVAGRWSYMFHPEVVGDSAVYYMQRTSRDRLRACIIIRRRPENRVIIFPKGLIPSESYTVSFQLCGGSYAKSGAELMDGGIVLRDAQPRELIYLNMPDGPGKHAESELPVVQRAYKRIENNVGVSGVGIYWCADRRGVWTSRYEIARNGVVIASVAKARYYFDSDSGWNVGDTYSVRGVSIGGVPGEWTAAGELAGTEVVISSLGDHGSDFGGNGWSAETSADLKTFEPMRWTPPAAIPGADLGGTPNQTGGIEGYWEGGECAKLGRGWCQASPDAYCVRTYTARRGGKVRLTGRAVKEWYHSEYGSEPEVCVMKNGEFIVPFTALRHGDISGLSYDIPLELQPGDVLRFVAGKCDPARNSAAHFDKDACIIGWTTMLAYAQERASDQPARGFSMRINCGGGELSDESGNVWLSDRCFSGGVRADSDKSVSGFNPALYRTARRAPVGETVRYTIPVPDGVYAVRLCFAETEFSCSGERLISVNINGSEFERELDIAHDIRSADAALAKVYDYIVPDADGNIDITLESPLGGAALCGIELAAENDDIVHINCGGGSFVDWAAFAWDSDRFYTGGNAVYEPCPALRQASPTLYDKELYFSGRSGREFSYRIPVRDGIYSVQLKFAELAPAAPGERPIDIYINGCEVKSGWDALSAAGEFPMSADLRFDDVSSADGAIAVRIKAAGEKPAILRAIEID